MGLSSHIHMHALSLMFVLLRGYPCLCSIKKQYPWVFVIEIGIRLGNVKIFQPAIADIFAQVCVSLICLYWPLCAAGFAYRSECHTPAAVTYSLEADH